MVKGSFSDRADCADLPAHFRDYLELCKRVDQFVAGIKARHESEIHCEGGCSSCCIPNITIWKIEADIVAAAVANFKISKDDLSDKDHCPLLGHNNLCSIYSMRPIVCRLWGVPQLYKHAIESRAGIVIHDRVDINMKGRGILTCCGKNFTERNGLETLHDEDIINIDTVLTTLAAINHVYCKEIHANPNDRIPLKSLVTLALMDIANDRARRRRS